MGLPIWVESFAPVGVLEQMCSIEVGQSVCVRGKVRWNPIQNYANPALVKMINEIHEVLRCSVARRWCKISGGLVAPGSVKRMLHDWQKLHMSEAHALG